MRRRSLNNDNIVGVPMMTSKLWYTERWDKDGKAAKWSRELPDFVAVRAVILDAREKGEVKGIRVGAPLDAARADLETLESLGAIRF